MIKPNILRRNDVLSTINLLKIIREYGMAPLSVEAHRLVQIYESMASDGGIIDELPLVDGNEGIVIE